MLFDNFFWPTFIVIKFSMVCCYVGQIDQYGDLIRTHINVVVEPLNIIVSDNITAREDLNCSLTLHRNLCFDQTGALNPVIDENEAISWNTRICFRWNCQNISSIAMRVENCWTGSMHNPIYLIDDKGCSLERTMIKTPRYEPSLRTSHSIGWLSVRLVGAKFIQLSCSMRICNICDKKCPLITPPNKCADQDPSITSASNIWNQTKKLKNYCTPSIRRTNDAAISKTNGSFLTIIFVFINFIYAKRFITNYYYYNK